MEPRTLTTVSGDTVSLAIQDQMYIDGDFVDSGEHFSTYHPATGERLADVPVATAEQVDEAVTAATSASHEWRRVSVAERGRRVGSLADALEAARENLVNLDVADNGSSIGRLKHDIEKGANKLRYFAGLGTELKGETIPTVESELNVTKREPYGAVAAIIPFNHPFMFTANKIGPAVMAGNGIVLKPSEYTPLSALYVAHVVDELDVFPDGLINVVTGAGEVGASLVGHDESRLVTMIGSANTGKKVMEAAASHLAPVILELGGKNPAIVFPDADIERTAEGAVGAMSLPWQGQSCQSGSRLLVHEDVYDDIVPRVVEGFESVVVGDPFEESTTMGSIVSQPQYERVLDYIETAKEEGATLLTGGSVIERLGDGCFVEPTAFEVDPGMTIATEEIFGPVLSVMPWSDYDEMIELANAVDYGLTASIWTNDLRTAHKTADRIEAGYVWVNKHGGSAIGTPFGGFKESGIGRNGNKDELLAHTRIKNLNISLDGELSPLADD